MIFNGLNILQLLPPFIGGRVCFMTDFTKTYIFRLNQHGLKEGRRKCSCSTGNISAINSRTSLVHMEASMFSKEAGPGGNRGSKKVSTCFSGWETFGRSLKRHLEPKGM